jgi:hypothetical protein
MVVENKFQHLGKRIFQVVTRTNLLQIHIVRNRFWSSLTIGRPGILNTADYAVTNNNRPFSDYTFLCEIHIKNGLHLHHVVYYIIV